MEQQIARERERVSPVTWADRTSRREERVFYPSL